MPGIQPSLSAPILIPAVKAAATNIGIGTITNRTVAMGITHVNDANIPRIEPEAPIAFSFTKGVEFLFQKYDWSSKCRDSVDHYDGLAKTPEREHIET